jgi:hypothetical protein
MITVVVVSILTGCTSRPENLEGDAGPAGAPSETATVSASAASPTTSSTSDLSSGIRRTDWANVTLVNLSFMGLGDTTFRNGSASSGANNCTMLPGGAQPAYAEYLTEEPANSPVTEDALILIECGSDGMDQALVPVKLGYDQKAREAIGFIAADPPTGPNNRMMFTSYSVESQVIVTTVRKADGKTETRRYRFDGSDSWVRF